MGLTRITSDGIADGAIAGADLADQSVTLAKLPHGTSSNDGKFLRANNGADPTFETVNTDLVGDTSPQLGGDLQSNGNDIDFADNDKAVFGTGGDLEIYHNGSNSYIDNGTGNLYFRGSNGQMLFRPNNSEDALVLKPNGAVELYHDNSKKLETSSVGWKSEDDVKGTFGTGGDLQIYHSGSNSFLKKIGSGTGHLYIDSDGSDLYLRAGDGSTGRNIAIKCTDNAGVDLRHQGNVKLETTSSGVTVSGGTVANGHITLPDHTGSQDGKLRFGAGTDLEIYHDGSNSYIDNSTGLLLLQDTSGLRLRSDDLRFESAGGSETYATLTKDGAVVLNFNNSQKFETTDSGIKIDGDASIGSIVQGDFRFKEAGSGTTRVHWRSDEGDLKFSDTYKATFGNSNDLQIYHDGSNSFILGSGTGNTAIQSNGTSSVLLQPVAGENSVVANSNSSVELFFDNSKKFETQSIGITVTGQVACDELDMADSTGVGNNRIKLGTGDDLQIYHDGSDSHIQDTGTGGLYLSTNQFLVRNAAGNELQIQGTENAGVQLYYNGSEHFKTSDAGAEVTGDLQVSGDIEDSGGGHGSTASEIFDGRAKVFVNFRGTSTVTIRQSKGVSSITDAGTGKYQINLSVNLANSNYTALGNAGMNDESGSDTSAVDIRDPNTTNFRLHNEDVDHGHTDREFMYAIVFTESA